MNTSGNTIYCQYHKSVTLEDTEFILQLNASCGSWHCPKCGLAADLDITSPAIWGDIVEMIKDGIYAY